MPVRKPRCYTLTVGTTFHNPADSTTYYVGGRFSGAPSTLAAFVETYVVKTGVIRGGFVKAFTENVAGTDEDIVMSIRINNTTDYAFATVGVGDPITTKLFENYNLNIPVTEGDNVEIKIVCPAWVTNPARVWWWGSLFIECP